MNQEQYQEWFDGRERILDELLNVIDAPTRAALNFTPESLRAAGEYLVRNFPSLADLHRPENRSRYVGLGTYVHEVFRRNLNLEPDLPLGDRQYQYHGRPVLHRPGGADISPFDLVTLTVHRREPNLLSEVFGYQREDGEGSKSHNPRAGQHTDQNSVSFSPLSEEDFAAWLTFLTDRLEGFADRLDDDTRRRFDLSPESLAHIGKWTVATAERGAMDDELVGDLTAYVAEAFHRNLGLQFFNSTEGATRGHPSVRDSSGAIVSVPQIILDTVKRRDPKLIDETFKRLRDGWIMSGRKGTD